MNKLTRIFVFLFLFSFLTILIIPAVSSSTYAATIYGDGDFTSAAAKGDASTYSKNDTPTYTFSATNTSGGEISDVTCNFVLGDLNAVVKYADYIDFISGTVTVGGSTYPMSKITESSGWEAASESFSVPNGTEVTCSIKIKILKDVPANPDVDPLGYAQFPLDYGLFGQTTSFIYAESSVKVLKDPSADEVLTLSVSGTGIYKEAAIASYKATVKNTSSEMANVICSFTPGEISGTGYGSFFDYIEFSSAKVTVGSTTYTVNKIEDTSKPGFWKLESAVFQLAGGATATCEFNVKVIKEAPLKLDTSKLGYMLINIGMTASKSDGSSYKSASAEFKIQNEALAAVAGIKLPSIFSGDTTDLSELTEESAKKIENFTLEVPGKGKIIYKEAVNLSGDAVIVRMEKLDEYVIIEPGSVEVKTDKFSELNKMATVYLYGLNLIELSDLPFVIYKNDKPAAGAVSNIKHEKGVLSFDVTGFSEYSFVPSISYEYERVDGKLKVNGSVNDLDAVIKLVEGDNEVTLEVSNEGKFEGEIDATSDTTVKLIVSGVNNDTLEKTLEGDSGTGKSTEETEKLFLGLDSVSWMLIGGGFLIFMGGFTFVAYKKGWLQKWMEAGKKFGENLRAKFSKKGTTQETQHIQQTNDLGDMVGPAGEKLGTQISKSDLNKITTKSGDEITFNEVKDN